MPGEPNHNHPEYERTFSKIATILEQLAEAAQQSNTRLDKLAESHGRLVDAMEQLTLKSAETEDKLNGLIDLMDRHIREHGKPN